MIYVKIKEQSILAKLAAYKLKSNAAAIVFGRTIHLWNISKKAFLQNERLVLHELEHVYQYQHFGFIPFIIHYLWESVQKGYHENRFEVEARQSEKNSIRMYDVQFV